MTLQQIINRIQNAINNSKQSSSDGSSSQKSSIFKLLPVIIIAGAIIVGVATTFFMVDATEQSVVLRFGKYTRTVGPGLHFKIPFTIEKNYNVPTQIIQKQSFGFRTAEAGVISLRAAGDYTNESTMLTGDLNIANVEWIIQYRITNPEAWLFNVENRNKTIYDISISVVNQLIGDYYITDVLGVAKTAIEEDSLLIINNFFKAYDLGVTVTAVRLQNVVPPEGRVQDAFEDVNKAEQDRNKLINEGKEEYNKVIPKSRGQAEQLIELARGYATERINQARGDVARFNAVLEEYRKSPLTTRNRLYYETIEEVLNNNEDTTTFIDGKFENLIPFLPLSQQDTLPQPQ